MPSEFFGGEGPADEPSRAIKCLAHGFSGVGKSGFGLSFPTPHYVWNQDRAIGELTKRLPKTHRIVYESVPADVDGLTQASANTLLLKFDQLMRMALKDGGDGTVMIDGWDLFWDTVKAAKLSESSLPKEYSNANAYMNNWLNKLGKSKLNVIFTTISSKVWTGAKTETDRVQSDGYKHKDRMLTHEVYMFSPDDSRQPSETPKVKDTGHAHQAVITMSKLNETLINRIVPSLTFGMLYRLTFGEAYPEPARLWSPASAAAAAVKEEVSATS